MKKSQDEFKVLLLGDTGVGKNTLISKFIKEVHLENLKLIIGVNFYSIDQEVDGLQFKLKLWIMSRKERFRLLLSRYCKGANGAFILYDITNTSTLELIPEWIKILREQVEDIPIMLIGMKLDLKEVRSVSKQKALEIVTSEGIDEYIECSTNTGENINKAFETLTRLMHDQSYPINYS